MSSLTIPHRVDPPPVEYRYESLLMSSKFLGLCGLIGVCTFASVGCTSFPLPMSHLYLEEDMVAKPPSQSASELNGNQSGATQQQAPVQADRQSNDPGAPPSAFGAAQVNYQQPAAPQGYQARPSTYTVVFKTRGRKPEEVVLPLTKPTMVHEALEASGAAQKFKRLTVAVSRVSNETNQRIKLEVKSRKHGREIDALYDYGIQPNDRVIVTEDTDNFMDDVITSLQEFTGT